MRYLLYLTLLLVTLCPGCSGGDASYAIGSETTPEYEAGLMASRLTPEEAALALTDWMERTPIDRQQHAAMLYAALRDSFAMRSGQAPGRLDRAIDSVSASLPLKRQARILVMSASPERLAAALTTDSAPELLRSEIRRLYEPYPDLLRRFMIDDL